MKRWINLILVLLALGLATPARAADGGLKQGDVVAICGDSITEQKLYSVYIEDYLLMCKPVMDLRTCQFGWSGETAGGFNNRMVNDALWLKPNVATTAYGMNDGGYQSMKPQIANAYRNNMKAIVKKFKDSGVRFIVVGSPGCVGWNWKRDAQTDASVYNATLAGLRDIAKEIAQQEGCAFANVFDAMTSAEKIAREKFGQNFLLAGGDAVHPGPNGHLVMAYAFLKAMGCDGNIGTITVDLGSDKAEATEGHTIVSSKGGTVEVESTRYPFCFFGKPNEQSTRSAIECMPFNDDLNRLKLVVKGAPAGKVKVTWGNESKEYTADQLAGGINLASEFIDNPFSSAFAKVEAAVKQQQNFETPLHKNLLHDMGTYRRMLPDEADAFDRILKGAERRQKEMRDASAAAVAPVKHTIRIEAVK